MKEKKRLAVIGILEGWNYGLGTIERKQMHQTQLS
jgi:hypothetical protein